MTGEPMVFLPNLVECSTLNSGDNNAKSCLVEGRLPTLAGEIKSLTGEVDSDRR
ncbi:hypothetical protein F2Q69_00052438 [Brassica cretica]|uniref:Uncharacterized protein n=1 Tax=Brassica cretica TaxID=69181 RepID=A0A8S9N211_BRACR|nr:hypothetical protein F2Q69_00052438 [Brassica cretica]